MVKLSCITPNGLRMRWIKKDDSFTAFKGNDSCFRKILNLLKADFFGISGFISNIYWISGTLGKKWLFLKELMMEMNSDTLTGNRNVEHVAPLREPLGN